MTSVVPFDESYLDEILALCMKEGWPSLPADRSRARRALTAPGVVTVVAVDDGRVIGFAQLLTDGEIQAYLSLLLVAEPARGTGVGRSLVRDGYRRASAERLDLLSTEGAQAFYESFTHRRHDGFRIYVGGDGQRA